MLLPTLKHEENAEMNGKENTRIKNVKTSRRNGYHGNHKGLADFINSAKLVHF